MSTPKKRSIATPTAIRPAPPPQETEKRPWPLVIIPTVCLLIALAAGLWNVPGFLAHLTSHFTRTHTIAHVHIIKNTHATNSANAVPLEFQKSTEAIAQQYMAALLNHQYTTMWSLLHPQVQAVWPGEAAFITYWEKRYQDYTLQSFTLGSVSWLPDWVNPETMIEYKQVLSIPVSLLLSPKPIVLAQSSVPPEDLHPEQVLHNLPFIVQRIVGKSPGAPVYWLVLAGGPADLETPILPPTQPIYTSVQVPILMYHHISNDVPSTALGMSLTVTTKMFTQQLDYLKQQGYQTITFNQLFDALYYAGPLPSHPIILTFDDGYDDAFQFAYPILKAHGYSGMFYIITGKADWAGYLNWPEIRTMFTQGMQIGSHTIHHVDIGNLFLYSRAMAQQELQLSQAALQKQLGTVIQQFCYPSGAPFKTGSLWLQQQIMTLLATDGYVGATTDPGMSSIYQSSLRPLTLLRVRVDGRSDLQFFENSLPQFSV